jgi:fatty acid desaturase
MSRGSGTQATKKQQNKASVAMSLVHVFAMTGAASLAGGYFWLLPAIVFVTLCLRLFRWIRARRTSAKQRLVSASANPFGE